MAAKRSKPPTQAQIMVLRRHGIDHRYCEVVQDFPNSMIIRSLETGQMQVIEKRKIPSN